MTGTTYTPFNVLTECQGEILIVDDTLADLRLLSDMLVAAGYNTRIAQTGQIALRSMQLQLPDLVLLDVRLTDITGYEICQQLKANPYTANVPIIFISALEHYTNKVAAFEAGGVDYITKPYQAAEVLARVNFQISHQRLKREHEAQHQALQKTEATQRAILQANPDLLLHLRADGTYLNCINCGQVQCMFGQSRDVSGLSIWEAMPPQLAERRMFYLGQALTTGEIQIYRQQFELDGELRYEECRIVRVHDDEALVIVRDISDLVKVENELHQKLRQERAIAYLTDQVNRSLDLNEVFSAMVQSVWETFGCDRVLLYRFNPDWSGEVLAEAVSAEWQEVMGSSDRQAALNQGGLLHKNCLVATRSHPHQGITLADTHFQTRTDNWRPEAYQAKVVPDIYQAGFSDCYLEFLAQLQARAYLMVPIYLRGKLWGLLGIYQNSGPRQWLPSETTIAVQAVAQLANAVQKAELFQQVQRQSMELFVAKEAAETANRAKSTFLANMSHELRTPMHAVLGFAQLLVKDENLQDYQREYLHTILESGRHLLELINGVLDLSKIEANRLEIKLEQFPLAEFLRLLQTMLLPQAEGKGLALLLDLEDGLPEIIQTDENKLRQVLINLLGNAIKFTSQGQVILRVCRADVSRASSWPEPLSHQDNFGRECLTFEVSDSGPGIAPEDQARIFEAFEQIQTSGHTAEGTGLGLAISSRFVEMLGGQIMLCSTLGQGSTFRFTIPVQILPDSEEVALPEQPCRDVEAEAQPDDRQVLSGSAVVAGLAPGQPCYRVLIVDDYQANCQMLAQLLGRMGFAIAVATNGEQALALWRSWQPNLILLDLRMPVMDGFETARVIRQQEQTTPSGCSPVKIIALTAALLGSEPEEAIAAGCDDYLPKPIDLEVLLVRIGTWLGAEYIYRDSPPAINSTAARRTAANRLTSEDLAAAMPVDWIRQLHQAALQCSDEQIEALLTHIPQDQAALRNALHYYTHQFQMEKILKLTEDCLEVKVLVQRSSTAS